MATALLIALGLLCLAASCALLFFLTRLIARTVGAACTFVFKKKPHPALLWVCAAPITLCVLLAWPMTAWNRWQSELYQEAIPPEFELTEQIFYDGTIDFEESCGVDLFRLSGSTLQRIQTEKLRYFESAHQGRGGNSYARYQPWQSTPAPKDVDLFKGAVCAQNPPAVLDQAQRAIEKEEAFYTTGHKQTLVVIPSLGLLVYSFGG